MIQDIAWSPRFVASTTATAATSADVNAGTDTNKFITPAALAGSTPTLTLTDVTFGTSGPSAKSSINARAARQGLVFDGTAGTTVSIPAFGTKGWTQAFWVYQTQIRGGGQLTYLSGSNGATAPNVAFLDGTNELLVYNGSSAFLSGYIVPTGKWINIVVSNDGTTTKFYANGIQVGSIADSTNYSGTLVALGSNGSSNSWLYGTLSGCLIYNRALSASEVVSLFEAGVPAAADYNTASNTALNTNTVTTSGSGSISGASATGFVATATAGYFVRSSPGIAMKAGLRYRITFTASALTGTWNCYFSNGSAVGSATPVITSGVNTFELASLNANTNWTEFGCGGAGTLTVSGFSMVAIGLLLAPDAAQAGNGYVWNDQSGNLAQIVLPSSGVAWNLPSIIGNRIRGTTSTNGNQQLLGASVLLPAECQITHVRARARSGTPTITIGTASGGAQIVASVALSTTWLNCTIALTGGIVSSADDIWVGSNSTDVVETDIAFQPLDF